VSFVELRGEINATHPQRVVWAKANLCSTMTCS